MTGADQDLDHVGEVVFARGIVGLNLVDVLPENVRAEAVDAHVAFADGELLGRAGLLLHDRLHASARVANHAAVAGRVVQHRR